jgi:hypothetical protein
MKRRPVIAPANRRGPTALKEQLRRKAAVEVAVAMIRRLDAELAERDPEFAMSVHRAVIRGLTDRMATAHSAARAVGVLAGAQAAIVPSFDPKARR